LHGVAVRSGSSPSFEALVAQTKKLCGADFDFGAEEWDAIPTEIGDYDAFPDGQRIRL